MSNEIYVYMAGPIAGCKYGQANDWRQMFADMLAEINPNIVGVSPLRCEPLIGEVYHTQYDDKRFGTPEAIQAKNFEDVQRCDVTVAFIPEDVTKDVGQPSLGTISEIQWAFALRKPRILISDVPGVVNNPVLKATIPWIFEESTGFRSACDVVTGIFGVYSGDRRVKHG